MDEQPVDIGINLAKFFATLALGTVALVVIALFGASVVLDFILSIGV